MKINRTNLLSGMAILAVAPWIIAATVERTPSDSTMVTITGNGQSTQAPKLVVIQAGVRNFASSATRALAENSEAIARLRSQLSGYGIEAKDIRTVDLSLSPGTDPEDHEHERRGFNVSQGLTIVFRDIDQSGHVVDALVAAGANEIRGPRFSSEPDEQALQVARVAAIRDADSRAQFYARALGLKVKRVVTMRDGGGYASAQPAMGLAYAPRAGGTEIAAGEDKVRASVYGEYELVR